MAPPPRLILIVLDSVPPTALTPELMPNLWQLATDGGYAPDGGRTALPAMTYPSNATIITGCSHERHGVRSNQAAQPIPGVVPGWAGSATIQSDSLFRACKRANLRSAAVLGDQNLYHVLCADDATTVWPPDGTPPAASLDPFGYAIDAVVWPQLLAAAADPELAFLFGHVNEPDTYGHLFGPDHARTKACYTAADRQLGALVAALRPDWERCLLIVTSDHGMENLGPQPIDLRSTPELEGILAEILPEGGCAWLRPGSGINAEKLASCVGEQPGVILAEVAGPELVLAVAEPGRAFHTTVPMPIQGFHGGPATDRILAVVGGGHEMVSRLANSVSARPPEARDWAPTGAAFLGLELLDADGLNLLEELF